MPQLLFLPGLACDHVMWQHQLAALATAPFSAFFTALKPAVTDVHTRFDRLEAMAAALLAEHEGELILCGASMGGMLAMEVARQSPERVKGLALLGTSARPETPQMRQLREGAIVFFEQGRAEEVLKFNLPMAFHKNRASDTKLTQTYIDFVLQAGAAQLISQNRAAMARPDARLHLPALRCPTLVLCGDCDQLAPPECSEEIAALIPGAEFKTIEQCGHMLTMERPAEVNTALALWLRRMV